MFKAKFLRLYIVAFFLLLPLLFFRNYVVKGQVPFPANLLVSFYSPWKFETFKGYEGGIPNKPTGFDNIKIFYPHLKLTISELSKGHIPYWNPFVFSGNVHVGLFQTAVFYPLNIVYMLLPMIDAWSLLVMVQPVIASICMYLFLRSLKISRGASVFGSIAYAYSGWMIAWWEESLVIEHSVLWLPLALFASSKIWESGWKLQYGTVLLFSLILSVLAGFFQTTMYVFITIFVWNLYLFYQSKFKVGKVKTLFLILGVCIASVGLTAIQWIPAAESFFLSPRKFADAKYLYESYLMPLKHLVTLIAPDFWGNPGSYNYFFPKAFYHEKVIFIGIVPLMFLLFAYIKNIGSHGRFWKIFSIITLSLGFQLPTSWIWYWLHVPILSSAQPSRIFVLTTVGFAVLAGFGFDYFLSHKDKKSMGYVLALIVGVLALLWLFVLANYFHFTSCQVADYSICKLLSYIPLVYDKPYMAVSLRNLIIPSGITLLSGVFILFARSYRRVLLYGVLSLSIISSLYFAQKYLYFSDRQFVFPETPVIKELKKQAGYNRVWSYGNAYVEKNFLTYYGLYSPEGYDPLFSQDYGELLNTIRTNGKITNNINRADVDLSPAGEDTVLMANLHRARLLNLLGVRFIIETKLGEKKDALLTNIRFPEKDFMLTWEDDVFRIWESKQALPRVFFSSDYRVKHDKQETADALFDTSIDLSKTVIVANDPFPVNQEAKDEKPNHSVAVISYEPSRVVISSKSDRHGVIFISDTYHPGWKAYVDGKETPIIKANYAFRAVPVSEGEHTITMQYKPSYFGLSLVVTILAMGLFSILSLIGKKA